MTKVFCCVSWRHNWRVSGAVPSAAGMDGVSLAVGFVSPDVLTFGHLVAGFRSVTDEYDCRLRKGMFSLGLLNCGPGVVDTFLACFFW